MEIERKGKRIVLRLEERKIPGKDVPDYRDLIDVPDLDNLDRWTWDWDPDEGLRLVELTE